MNTKEIGEIRRRQKRERSNMTAIYGCYVNDQKEIVHYKYCSADADITGQTIIKYEDSIPVKYNTKKHV